MKAYGVKKKDSGCCPGHNKFSDHSYNNQRSVRAKSKDTKYAHSRERSAIKISLSKEVNQLIPSELNDIDLMCIVCNM